MNTNLMIYVLLTLISVCNLNVSRLLKEKIGYWLHGAIGIVGVIGAIVELLKLFN